VEFERAGEERGVVGEEEGDGGADLVDEGLDACACEGAFGGLVGRFVGQGGEPAGAAEDDGVEEEAGYAVGVPYAGDGGVG
jgi:hypothetical protein